MTTSEELPRRVYSTLMRDPLPRMLSYPVDPKTMSDSIDGHSPQRELVFFFLYDSCAQKDYYDPARSSADRYPVMVAHPGLPDLRFSEPGATPNSFEEPGVQPRSLLIFPVKQRLKMRIRDSLLQQASVPLRNWISAGSSSSGKQRPLVFTFDETSGRITTSFAGEWDGRPKERIYR